MWRGEVESLTGTHAAGEWRREDWHPDGPAHDGERTEGSGCRLWTTVGA